MDEFKQIKEVLALIVKTLQENPDFTENLTEIVTKYGEVLSPLVEGVVFKCSYQHLAARLAFYNETLKNHPNLTHAEIIDIMRTR